MKKNKLLYILPMALVLAGLAFFSFTSANDERVNIVTSVKVNTEKINNEKNGEDRGHSEQAQEAQKRGTTMEVHISNKGKVIVQGAKVTAISSDTVSASSTWGLVNLNWSVNVLPDTHIIRRFNGAGSIAEISVGDIIGFQGNLVNTTSSPIAINATQIKDWSIQKKDVNFNGVVKSIDGINNKFVLSSVKNGDITVITSSLTKFKKGDGNAVFTDITLGARILASGVYDSQLKELKANEVKIYISSL